MYDDGKLSEKDIDARVRDTLRFDPLQEAEDLTGKSYKESKETESLGFALNLFANAEKKLMLKSRKDSYFGIPLNEYEAIVREIGFELVYEEMFPNDSSWGFDKFKIWFHPVGILLKYDTYGPNDLNGGQFYYNVEIKKSQRKTFFNARVTSSGGMSKIRTHHITRYMWSGNHDCREAIRFNIEQLMKHAKFMNPWREVPFLWLLNYRDTKEEGYDYRTLSNDRWKKLPDNVRQCVPKPFMEPGDVDSHCRRYKNGLCKPWWDEKLEPCITKICNRKTK